MSEKDVKDNETEALNNAAAENAENADIGGRNRYGHVDRIGRFRGGV